MSFSLDTNQQGKVILVTAGADGIGRVIAETFLAAGANVHICDINPEKVAEFVASREGITGSVADVANAEAVSAMFDDLKSHHGRLDVLVNNAGIAGPTSAVEDIDIETWDHTIAVDINGQFYCTKHAVPLLKESSSGSIINLSSNAGLFGFPLRSPYAASKWALIGLTKTWAMELGPHGIRVNALCPGSVKGSRIEGVIERDAAERGVSVDHIRKVYSAQSSLRLFVEPEDVAQMALFLCSPCGANISGQAIGIDGHTESLSNSLDIKPDS